jgi:hypothetical protein
VTERAVFELHEGRMTLIELAPGIDLERNVLAQMEFTPLVAGPLAPVPDHLFYEKWGRLRSIITAAAPAGASAVGLIGAPLLRLGVGRCMARRSTSPAARGHGPSVGAADHGN